MKTRLTLSAGLLLGLVPTVLADGPVPGDQAQNQVQHNGVLLPRAAVFTKPDVITRPAGVESRLIVKFADRTRMRVMADGTIEAAGGAAPGGAIQRVIDRYGLSFESVFEQSLDQLRELEERAAMASGRNQPDLGGIMYVNGPDRALENAANALNRLGSVEYVHFHTKPVEHGVGTSNLSALRAAAQTLPAAAGGSIPNFVSSQGYARFFNDLNDNDEFDIPFGVPFWLAPEFSGGIDLHAAAGWDEFLRDENLVHPDWDSDHLAFRGDTIRIGIIEFNAAVDPLRGVHVDLENVVLEPGQILLPEEVSGVDHGTATLSIAGAEDHGLPGPDLDVEGDDAEIGIVGLAPGAETWFFPIVSASQPGGRLISAIVSALLAFDRGDVLSFSIGFPPGPVILNPTVALLIRMGSDVGITSCGSAGNSCFNHDDFESPPWPEFDTGIVIVGAGMPILAARPDLAPYTRLGFSNHYEASGRVHVQAWGADMFTAGYGDAFDIDGDQRFRYSATFGGTSSACPMIAANVAILQAFSKMRYGIPLMPEQIRAVVSGGIPQDGQLIPAFISGTLPLDEDPPGNPCDPAEYDPLLPPDRIGNFPLFDTNMNTLLTSSWFDPSFVEDHIIYNGDHIFGNTNSLRASDNNPLLVRSKFNGGGFGGGGGIFPTPVFMFPGEFTDIGVAGFILNPNSPSGAVTFRLASNAGVQMAGWQAYNWNTGNWDWLGVDNLMDVLYHDQRLLPNPTFPFTSNHINEFGRVIIRGWVLRLGFGGPFTTSYDAVFFGASEGPFGEGGGLGDG